MTENTLETAPAEAAAKPARYVQTANGAWMDTETKKFVSAAVATGTAPAATGGTGFPDDGATERKKPGRKPLPRDADGNIIRDAGARSGASNPEPDAVDPVGPRPTRKARAQPQAEAEPQKPEYSAEAKSMLARQCVGVHQMLALMTGFPELAISAKEGEILAEAMAGIATEYGVAVSGKTAASMQMLAACAIVYAPRAVAIKVRIDGQKRARKNQQKSAEQTGVVVNGVARVMDVPQTSETGTASESPPDIH